MMNIQKVPARNVVLWYQSAWQYFKAEPFIWAGMAAVWILAAAMFSFVPSVGAIANMVLFPIAYAGFLYGVHEVASGRGLKFEYLWYALMEQQRRNFVVAMVILPLGYSMIADIITLALGFNPLTTIILITVSIGISLALIFAVPLVLFENIHPIEAIKTSFQAGVVNVASLGLLLVVNVLAGGLLAMLTFGFASIVVLPITVAALYSAYRDILKS